MLSTGQWRRSLLQPWAGRQSYRQREIPPPGNLEQARRGPTGAPRVFVTSLGWEGRGGPLTNRTTKNLFDATGLLWYAAS